MKNFTLLRPKAVSFKINGVSHSEWIETLVVGPLTGEPDEVEIAARRSLVRGGSHPGGEKITLPELEGLDVSGAIRDAYRAALARARELLAETPEGKA